MNVYSRLLSTILLISTASIANAENLQAFRLGLTASVAQDGQYVGFNFHLLDWLMLAGDGGFTSSSYYSSNGFTSTRNSTMDFSLGVGAYLQLTLVDKIYLNMGPRAFVYQIPKYKELSTDYEVSRSDYAVEFNIMPKAMITDSFGFFSVVGVQFRQIDLRNYTTSTNTSYQNLGMSSSAMGVVYYLW